MARYFLNLTNSDGELLDRFEIAVPELDGELEQLMDDEDLDLIYTGEDLKKVDQYAVDLESQIKRNIRADLGYLWKTSEEKAAEVWSDYSDLLPSILK